MKAIYLILVATLFLTACQTASNQLSEEDINRLAERLQDVKKVKTEAVEPTCRTVLTNYTEKEPYTTTELKTKVEGYIVQEPRNEQEPYETTEKYFVTEEYDEHFDFSGCSFGAFCGDVMCSGSEQFSNMEQLMYLNTKCTANSELRQVYCDAGTLSQHSLSEIYSCPSVKKTRQVEKTRVVTNYKDVTTLVNFTRYRNITEPVEVTKYKDVIKSKEEQVCS